jgi:hypothetical protein
MSSVWDRSYSEYRARVKCLLKTSVKDIFLCARKFAGAPFDGSTD